ncbi:tRNA modification GTPase TrmE [Peniophora sp. CONT]|nr:tRNA modification GTPase TrmE [Peniophora sp. CONT]
MLRIWGVCSRRRSSAGFLSAVDYRPRPIFDSRAIQARYVQTPRHSAFSGGSQASWSEPRSPATSDAQRQTIYALASASGPAGIAVVRVSGPRARDVRAHMVRPAHRRPNQDPVPWKLERCTVVDPETEEVLDDALAVFFPGPRSFTTEDVLELHIHGGRAVAQGVLNALGKLSFARGAAPGEFTRRAFEAGRLDLTQVEGIKDLVDARTDVQRRAALRAASGTSRKTYEGLRKDIIKCLANIEAVIDFGDTEDVESGVFEAAQARADELRGRINAMLADGRRGELVRSGVRLALFGPPNAGKSSLLNFLAQREAAIVTPIPGTTRDVLEVSVDLGGVPVLVSDTAGLRESTDTVESIGIARARSAIESADLRLLVLSLPDVLHEGGQIKIPVEMQDFVADHPEDTFVLLNKTDLTPTSALLENVSTAGVWAVSLTEERGTSNFLQGLARALRQRFDVLQDVQDAEDSPVVTHARHRQHLESALRFLDAFLAHGPDDIVIAAEELRYAAQAVGRISGLIDVEDVLDVVFRDFCIGK